MQNSILLSAKRLNTILKKTIDKNIDINIKPAKENYYSFKKLQKDQTRQQIESLISSLKQQRPLLTHHIMNKPEDEIETLYVLKLLRTIEEQLKNKNILAMKTSTEKLISTLEGFNIISVETKKQQLQFITPQLPKEIEKEVQSDIQELERCFDSKCFKSCAILCGRILETVLHRKYYEETGHDILEKSPGIGLGNLVAKLSEKKIFDDPGLTQQIHLINQVRIFSVHKKKIPFHPSKNQIQAMILYTVDIVNKLFKSKKAYKE